jgi:glycine oxidase
MTAHPDVLILGGGVIGLTTALRLADAGAAVTLLDQGDLGRAASWAGAGIIPPGDPARARSPYDRLRALSSSLYPGLSQELRERTGIDNGYVVCGGWQFFAPDEAVPEGEWREEGIACEEFEPWRLAEAAPGLTPPPGRAFYLPGTAQVRNPRHLKALIAACGRAGVRLRPGCAARRLDIRSERVVGVEMDDEALSTGRVLIAAGAWSEALLAQAGWRPGVRPVRGQIALLDTGRPGTRPIVEVGKRYLVPRPDGKVLAGSTEEEVGFDARPTAGGVEGLLRFAVAVMPSLVDATPERCWAGLRPGSPDGMPFLGPVPGVGSLFVAAGHFRAGIQLSPATAEIMAALLLDRAPPLPADDFRLGRPVVPTQAAFRS